MPFFIFIFWKLQKLADTRKKLPPLKPLLALQTWGQKCFNSEVEPFKITDFDLGHPVVYVPQEHDRILPDDHDDDDYFPFLNR